MSLQDQIREAKAKLEAAERLCRQRGTALAEARELFKDAEDDRDAARDAYYIILISAEAKAKTV